MAEAIQKAEYQEITEGPTQRATWDASMAEEATATTAHATRPETTTVTAPTLTSQERGEPMMGRTPLQRLHETLGRKFGYGILRTPASNAKTIGGSRDVHRLGE
jgi:hypothetical protein